MAVYCGGYELAGSAGVKGCSVFLRRSGVLVECPEKGTSM